MNSAFFNEDHEDIRELARDFARKELAPIAAEIDKTEKFPLEVVKQMADLGFFGIKIPEEYGGMGLDMRSYIAVMEEISKKCATATLFISSANSLSTAPIVISGTKEQKGKYLPPVAAGDSFITFALSEPNAGSDAASLSSKAVDNGDSYILNGRKCFITLAPLASHSIVYVKTAPEKGAKGITAFMVDMNLPGVSVGNMEEKMGQRGVPVSDVVLDDVQVSKDCVLGEIDMGFINAMKTLSVGRVGVASMALGIAQEAIDLAVSHTKNRIQFGKPLCKNQAIAFMLADMETKLNAARLLVYNAAWLMDNNQPADKAASMAKLYATDTAIEIVNQSLQLHGGYGYSKEYEIERLYRDIRVTSIYEGSSQIQQIVISNQMLK
jgi:alkylation response protein AidB-like acyl-CoA dehydrogenase